MRDRLMLLLALCLAFAPSTLFAQDQVWFETPIAEITIGYDEAISQSRQRAYYLAFIGPKAAIQKPSAARQCAELTVQPQRNRLRTALDLSLSRRPKQPGNEWIKKDIADTNRALLNLTLENDSSFFACLRKEGAPSLSEAGFYLSLVQRDCVMPVCKKSKTRQRLSDDSDVAVFESVYRWVAVKSAVEQRNQTGLHFRLAFKENSDTSVYLQTGFGGIREVNNWPPTRSSEQLAKDFRALVLRVRDLRGTIRPRISYVAPLIAGISAEGYVKVVDALVAPSNGFGLVRASGGDSLADLSNEIARAQLFECRYYRGFKSMAELAKCAGYTLTQEQLANCLGARKCDPPVAATQSAQAILMSASTSLKDVGQGAILPRYLPGDLQGLKAVYDRCEAAGATGRDRCIAVSLLETNTDFAKIRTCWSQKDGATKVSCSIRSFEGKISPGVACAKSSSQRTAANCILSTQLPPQAQQAWACANKVTGQTHWAKCAAGLAGGDAARIADCQSQSKGSTLRFVTCVGKGKVDAKVARAIECAHNARGTASIAACAASSQLPEKLSEQIGCVVQAQGEPLGTGVCIAASELNLNPNQQLALQCLASSAGEPTTFAACVAGQLTMKELAQCKGKSFGEENCFGENNEFQKLAKAITGKNIEKDSTVGQIININLKPYQLVYNGIEPITDKAVGTYTRMVQTMIDTAKQAASGDAEAFIKIATNPVLGPIVFIGKDLGIF